jgi:AraC family transcriptional regulator
VLTEFAQPPSLAVPRHTHECATILFTLQGAAADRMCGRDWECKPASLLVRPPGEPHTHLYGRAGAHCLVVEVKPSRLKAIRALAPVLERVGQFADARLAGLGLRLCGEARIADDASELAIEGLVLEMLAQAVRGHAENAAAAGQPYWLRVARDFIHAHYTERLTLAQIATVCGVHPAHLAEVFRRHQRATVGQYVRRLRLDYAAREVLLAEKSLAEISVAAGFYDQSHFTKIFKRHTGLAPAEMRAALCAPKAHTKSLRLSKPD